MSDLRDPNAPETRPAGATTGNGASAATAPDPLHNLYRMSRTAGLGSGDYVAINNTSILALVLGLASVLSWWFPLMMIAAVAAVVCGILALVQIQSSNGTQTGRAFALLGILSALALGGASIGSLVLARMEQRRDEQAIGQLVKELSDQIVAKNYAQAYNTLFTDRFKQDFGPDAFAATWERFVPSAGAVREIGWGQRAEFEPVTATGEKRAVAQSALKFEKFDEPARQAMRFARSEGKWLIDGINQLFEKAPPTRGAPGAPAMPDPSRPLGPMLPPPPTIPSPLPGGPGAG